MAKSKPHRRPAVPAIPATRKAPAPTRQPLPPPDWKALADRYALPALGVLLAIGFVLRSLYLDSLSLWIDEFVHVLRAKNVVAGTGSLLTNDNNGILLTVAMLPFFMVFGPTAFWARFPSVLFGVGIIYLLYRLGERLFNRYVGLLAAFAGTFSLYLTFWSRMGRNYAIFAFFILLLGLVFLKAFEGVKTPEASGFWAKHGFSRRHWLWLPAVLLAALLSHQLTFFFAFSVGAYALIMAGGKLIRGAEDRFRNKYLWLGLLTLPLMALTLPGINELLRGPLSPLLSPQQLDWILPRWSRLAELWDKQPWEAVRVYHGVLRYDPTLLYFPGVAGLVAAFALRPRSGAWLCAQVVVPFLLMSFLFREPALDRYFIFVFPYFLLSAAVFFYWLFEFLTKNKFPNASKSTRYALLIFPFLFVLASVRWPELKRLVLAEQLEGHVVNNNISQYNFTNWRQPCDFVRQKRQSGDVLMATVTTASSYYLQDDNVLWFRQVQYDTKQKRYIPNPPEPGKTYSAASFEDLQRTVATAPRGWLLADYYMDNVFVDERSRLFVYQNMHLYPEASPDGSVMVFGWDRSKPRPQQQNLVVQLGKAADKVVSKSFGLNIPAALFQAPKLQMVIRQQGVNSDGEALVVFNDNNAVYLRPNQGLGIETQVVDLQKEWVRPGQNKVQIMYEETVKRDPDKGFTVYFIDFTGQ